MKNPALKRNEVLCGYEKGEVNIFNPARPGEVLIIREAPPPKTEKKLQPGPYGSGEYTKPKSAKENNMTLVFSKHKPKGRNPLTKSEINELSCLAGSIESLAVIMQDYACGHSGSEASGEAMANCMCVFDILEILIQPITDYLSNYAGDPAEEESS